MSRRILLRLFASLLIFGSVAILVLRDRINVSSNLVSTLPLEHKKMSVHESNCPRGQWIEGLRTIYMITPTYKRAEQIPELIRTSQTLLHVPNLMWIVVEDAKRPTKDVEEYLSRSGMHYVYMTAQMPKKYLKVKNKPRGVANRNAGLEWVRNHAKSGVVYFGDDDNTYDIRIFEEIRSTKGISMFPVGLVADYRVSSPVVKGGVVIGFYDGWVAGRKFPVDMAGFAVSVERLLQKRNALMPFKVGYEEDYLLQRLGVVNKEIEIKSNGCTEILVWHTQTKKNTPLKKFYLPSNLTDTNISALKKYVWTGT